MDAVGGRIRSFVERVERLQEEIDGLNADKSEVFKEARGTGLEVKAIRSLIKERRDPQAARELSETLDLYRAAMNGTENATRACREIEPKKERREEVVPPAPEPSNVTPIRSVEQTAAPEISRESDPVQLARLPAPEGGGDSAIGVQPVARNDSEPDYSGLEVPERFRRVHPMGNA